MHLTSRRVPARGRPACSARPARSARRPCRGDRPVNAAIGHQSRRPARRRCTRPGGRGRSSPRPRWTIRTGRPHSLNTRVGWSATRSVSVSSGLVLVQPVRRRPGRPGSPASSRRDMSCRAGIEQNARVSSMNPDSRLNPAISVTDCLEAAGSRPGCPGTTRARPRRPPGRTRPAARSRGRTRPASTVNSTRWKPGSVPYAVEQRLQRPGELDRHRDVVAGVRAVPVQRCPGGGCGGRPGAGSSPGRPRHDIRAISKIMCRRNAVASAGGGLRRPAPRR